MAQSAGDEIVQIRSVTICFKPTTQTEFMPLARLREFKEEGLMLEFY